MGSVKKIILLAFFYLFPTSLWAYNFLYVHPTTGQPIGWEPGTTIRYYVDPGPLGELSNEQARTLLRAAMDIWENASPYANVPHFEYVELLPEDVNGTNYSQYVSLGACYGSALSSCPTQAQRELNTVIIFDDDGSILEDSVCAFGGCEAYADARVFSGSSSNITGISQGIVILGGDIVSDSPSLSVGIYHTLGIMTHELGHLLGLAHTVVNQEVYINSQWTTRKSYLPTMVSTPFPDGTGRGEKDQASLNPDDIAAMVTLYPESTATANTGTIEGEVTQSNGNSMHHANVIVRSETDPLCKAYSFLSGRICPEGYQLIGTTVCQNDDGDSLYQVGNFIISGLPSGSYTLEVEEIADDFLQSSYTPALVDVFLAGDAEFWNTNDTASESNTTQSLIGLSAGESEENINIILNRSEVTSDRVKSIPLSSHSTGTGGSGGNCQPVSTDYATLLGLPTASTGGTGGTTDSPASGCSLIRQ